MKNGVGVVFVWLMVMGGGARADDSTVWQPGELQLRNGTEVLGELNFNWVAQVVQVRQGAVIKAYSANGVQAFTYFDDQQKANRMFVARACPMKSGLSRTRILEEVIAGSLRVYRELRPVHELIKVGRLSDYSTVTDFSKDTDNFNYYVCFDDVLVPLNSFYRTIWPRIRTPFSRELRQYANLIHADMNDTVGRLRLLHKYNALTEDGPQPAPPEPATESVLDR